MTIGVRISGSVEDPSMLQGEAWPDRLIEQARRGDDAARGDLLELYRNYLRLVARSLIGGALRIKLDPSDLVQETFLKAHRNFARFAGETEARAGGLAAADPDPEPGQPGQAPPSPGARHAAPGVAGSPARAVGQVPSSRAGPHAPSPSEAASRREQAVLLADAVDRLPSDYREAFVLRTLEHVPFEEIAERMGRSTGAVRMLWREP